MISAEKYEFLFTAKPDQENVGTNARVSCQRVKETRAGNMLYIACYPMWSTIRETERIRDRKPSNEARKKLNEAKRRWWFEARAHANFSDGDFYFTGTHSPSPMPGRNIRECYVGEPESEEEAQIRWRKFVRALRKLVKEKGGDTSALRYMAVMDITQTRLPDPDYAQEKYHHHALIGRVVGHTSDGQEITLTRNEIEDIWWRLNDYGRARCERLRGDVAGISGVSQYLVRQEHGERIGKGGQRRKIRYSTSKNLKKPVERVSDKRISRRRARRMALESIPQAREIMEALYPGYRCCEDPRISTSDFCAGVYIRAKLYRKTE